MTALSSSSERMNIAIDDTSAAALVAASAVASAAENDKTDCLLGENISLDDFDMDDGEDDKIGEDYACRDDQDGCVRLCKLIDEDKIVGGGSNSPKPLSTVSNIERCPCCSRTYERFHQGPLLHSSFLSSDDERRHALLSPPTSPTMTMVNNSSAGTTMTISGSNTIESMSLTRVGWVTRSRSLVTEMMIDGDDDNSSSTRNDFETDPDESDRMMPGLLSKGIPYTVKTVLFQGHLHKKGSGFDWFGSRSWKSRWAVLVVSYCDLPRNHALLLASASLFECISQ